MRGHSKTRQLDSDVLLGAVRNRDLGQADANRTLDLYTAAAVEAKSHASLRASRSQVCFANDPISCRIAAGILALFRSIIRIDAGVAQW